MNTNVRVAFLAHEIKSILDQAPNSVSPGDQRILLEGVEFLSAGFEAGQKLASNDFNAALTNQVEAFGWLASVLAITVGRENANSSAEVAGLIGNMRDTLKALAEGEDVKKGSLTEAKEFFRALRDYVLESQRQAPTPPELRGVA